MAGLMETDELLKPESLTEQEPTTPAATLAPAPAPPVTPANPTPPTSVAGEVENLLSKESGLMTRARTQAAQTANARGLLNSSMAAGAGEEAAINTALPIATADAAAKNQFGLTKLQGDIESDLFTRQAEQQTLIQNLQTSAAKELADIEANYKTVMQTSATAGQIMAAAQDGINQILKDTTLSNDAKTALVTKIQDGLEAQMGVIGGIAGLDLTSLLVFPDTPIAATKPTTTTPTTPTTTTTAASGKPNFTVS